MDIDDSDDMDIDDYDISDGTEDDIDSYFGDYDEDESDEPDDYDESDGIDDLDLSGYEDTEGEEEDVQDSDRPSNSNTDDTVVDSRGNKVYVEDSQGDIQSNPEHDKVIPSVSSDDTIHSNSSIDSKAVLQKGITTDIEDIELKRLELEIRKEELRAKLLALREKNKQLESLSHQKTKKESNLYDSSSHNVEVKQ